jgi:hypothetical protein
MHMHIDHPKESNMHKTPALKKLPEYFIELG